jgi:hypothetical protein
MGDLRTNQLISTFGTGAIYDMVNYSVIILSADYWLKSKHAQDLIIHDNAVQAVVQARIQELTDFKIRYIKGLMMPPFDPEDQDETERASGYVLAHRFPLFHRCNRCGVLCRLKKSSDQVICNHKYSLREGLEPCGSLKQDWQRGTLEAVRFISKCEDGHLNDFSWVEFKQLSCDDACKKHTNFGNYESIYYLEETAQGDFFKSIKIHCRQCKKSTTLDKINRAIRKINDEESGEESKGELEPALRDLFKCKGWRPWIDEEDSHEQCNKTIEFVPRGASNVYIPQKENYISIPKNDFLSLDIDTNHYLEMLFGENLKSINSAGEESMIDADELINIQKTAKEEIPNIIKYGSKVIEDAMSTNPNYEIRNSIEEEKINYLQNLIEWKLSNLGIGSAKIERDYKLNEFDSLNSEQAIEEFVCSPIELSDNGYLKTKFVSISKVEKLKIIGVLLGFHRSFDMKAKSASKFHPVINQPNFLPASVIFGEGIFLNFDIDAVELWQNENAEFIQGRDRLLLDRSLKSLQYRDPKNTLYLLIHSFSHMLMKQLAFESGFSVTELTEKIYHFEEEKKIGVLIHTSSGDSQCSMGGLSDLADEKKLEGMIKRALSQNISCSNDPICIDSEGQGTSSLSHGACFGCLMLPETCCEVRPIKNSFLDRNLLIDFNLGIKSFF